MRQEITQRDGEAHWTEVKKELRPTMKLRFLTCYFKNSLHSNTYQLTTSLQLAYLKYLSRYLFLVLQLNSLAVHHTMYIALSLEMIVVLRI